MRLAVASEALEQSVPVSTVAAIPDGRHAGNPQVQFDKGAQETCDSATPLSPTLRSLPYPQISEASSTMRESLAHCWSSVRRLPSSVLAKPHCGQIGRAHV